jgi:hypothetical protein
VCFHSSGVRPAGAKPRGARNFCVRLISSRLKPVGVAQGAKAIGTLLLKVCECFFVQRGHSLGFCGSVEVENLSQRMSNKRVGRDGCALWVCSKDRDSTQAHVAIACVRRTVTQHSSASSTEPSGGEQPLMKGWLGRRREGSACHGSSAGFCCYILSLSLSVVILKEWNKR